MSGIWQWTVSVCKWDFALTCFFQESIQLVQKMFSANKSQANSFSELLLMLIKLVLVLSSANLPFYTLVNKSQLHSLICYCEVNPEQFQWCPWVRAFTHWKSRVNSLKSLALLQVHTATNVNKLEIKIHITSRSDVKEAPSAMMQTYCWGYFFHHSLQWTESISLTLNMPKTPQQILDKLKVQKGREKTADFSFVKECKHPKGNVRRILQLKSQC